MSKFYTTGEIAKLCGVSVRTVQYYDDRKILVPTELSEGGRRLYTESDLKRMHIICFLREAGLPIGSISALFAEEKPESIISVLLDQQEAVLREELAELVKSYREQTGCDIHFINGGNWIPAEPLHPLRDGHKIVAENLTRELGKIIKG